MKLKKLLTVLLTAAVLLGAAALPAGAYSEKELRTADALYTLGLFLGDGTTYSLDKAPTREQGVVLMVRMLGKEALAKTGNYSHPFRDVSGWMEPYAAYAYESGITKGTGADTFSGGDPLTDWMFLTFCLRALGYRDTGDDPDFYYRDARVFAKEIGLVAESAEDADFTRGDIVTIFWQELGTCKKGSDQTLADFLIGEGAFTESMWKDAGNVERYGKSPYADSGEKSTVVAREPDPIPEESDTVPEEPEPVHVHTPVTDPAVPAGCTTAGKTEGSHCASCGEILVPQKTVPAAGHDYRDDVCTVCGSQRSKAPTVTPELSI